MKLNKTMIWAAVAATGLALIALGPKFGSVAMIFPGIVALLLGAGWLLRDLSGRQNSAAIQRALREYDEIVGGVRWIGSVAEVLASDRVDVAREPGPVRFEQVCRTPKGAWFIFNVSVAHGRIVDRNLTPCDERQAKNRLQRHRDVYVRCFGEPESA